MFTAFKGYVPSGNRASSGNTTLLKRVLRYRVKSASRCALLSTDGQDITHAISSQQLASPHPYTKEYKESIRGQGPTDPAVAYPEHELHKKAMILASSVSLVR